MKIMPKDQRPKAIKYLQVLHQQSPSPQLLEYLSSLAMPKEETLYIFIEGIQKFTRIANLNSTERKEFYGNEFCGVHYNNDLAALWNSQLTTMIPAVSSLLSVEKKTAVLAETVTSPDVIKSHQLNFLCPFEWDYNLTESRLVLVYKGNSPSVALDNLLQGPTVIDCAIFCQLSIWFGIRYMLGNAVFDEAFGKGPFYLTQVLYNSIEAPSKPSLGNPLYSF